MIRIANKSAGRCVTHRVIFKGSHTFAQWEYRKEGKVYKVYSYGEHFPIYAYKGGQWYKNKDRYSVSTSKHQSQLHPGLACIELSTEEIKAL